MQKTSFLIIPFLLLLVIVLSYAENDLNSISFSTYYPAPYGVYKNMRIYPNDDTTPGADCSNEGELYYDKSDHSLMVCSGSTTKWVMSGVPIGSIFAHAAVVPPAGYLECNGQEISRTEYASLFAAISTIYGSGNGATTFNVPNLMGRVPTGLDIMQPEFDLMGKFGGEKSHVLSVAEMPSHTHSYTSPANGNLANSYTTCCTSTTGGTTGPAGGDLPHNNLQPYLVIKYIIKAK